MARLGELFSQTRRYEKTSVRTFYSTVDLSKSSYPSYIDRKQQQPSFNAEFNNRLRSPSLPPIRRNVASDLPRLNTTTSEEETSGYASDSGNQSHSPDIWNNERNQSRYPSDSLNRSDQYYADEEHFLGTQQQSNKSYRQTKKFIHGQGQESHHNIDVGHETDFSTTTK